ncbi:hypothetical protein DRO69_11845 [Candidatus Bathyarchaeota archaeon]|nr:MAG: hypothetical protein DRO69_11845 [Candidatus Bathyarchaeota archaeon]
MAKDCGTLMPKIIELLKENLGQTIKELAKQLKVNRSFLAGYLKALEEQGYVKSKRIGPAKVYFNKKVEGR